MILKKKKIIHLPTSSCYTCRQETKSQGNVFKKFSHEHPLGSRADYLPSSQESEVSHERAASTEKVVT